MLLYVGRHPTRSQYQYKLSMTSTPLKIESEDVICCFLVVDQSATVVNCATYHDFVTTNPAATD